MHARGLVVDAGGVALGPDLSLVRLEAGRFRCVDRATLDKVCGTVDRSLDAGTTYRQLTHIAGALEKGEILRAQLLALQIPLGELGLRQLHRLARLERLNKANYNQAEARDRLGEWSRDGSTSSTGRALKPPLELPEEATEAAGARAATLAREAQAAAEGVAVSAEDAGIGILGAAAAAIGGFAGLLYSLDAAPAKSGTLPENPDITYHDDEGRLFLSRRRADGNSELLYDGSPDENHQYRNANGRIIGRDLGDDFEIDVGKLDLPPFPQVLTGPRSWDEDHDEEFCPEPSWDRPNGEREPADTYQEQITGLPRGMAVWLGGVEFDGCRESDGTMIDAKGPNYLALYLKGPENFPWLGAKQKMLNQAASQRDAAGLRRIEWYFAEKKIADEMAPLLEQPGLDIHVFHVPYKPGLK